MKTITTLVLFFISVACFSQKMESVVNKIDSIKLNQWEVAKIKAFDEQNKTLAQLQFQIDAIKEIQKTVLEGILSHSEKKGAIVGFRNDHLIINTNLTTQNNGTEKN